jgi:chitinase
MQTATIKNTVFGILLLATAALAGSKVLGYFPFWAQYAQFSPEKVRYSMYSDIVYGYMIPGADGALVLADMSDEANYQALIQKAKANSTNIWISIGGPGNAEAIAGIAGNESAINAMAKSAATIAQEIGATGVELSWEFPQEEQKEALTSMVNALQSALSGKAKLAVSVHSLRFDAYDVAALQAADFVNVLALDMSTTDASSVQANCDVSKAKKALRYYEDAGVAKSKLILTVPFYGRSYLSGKSIGSSHEGVGSGNEGIISWNDIIAKFESGDYTAAYDDDSQSELAISSTEVIVFNGIKSIKALAQLVESQGYAGIQIADVASDHREPSVSLTVTVGKVLRPQVEYGKSK